MKRIRVYAALAVGLLACFGWSVLHPQKAAASNDPSGTYLITFQNANRTFKSNSIITLHADHSVAVVDSSQETGSISFSSQQGVWERESGGVVKARTIDWSFPFANDGSARLDYTFDAGLPANQVQGCAALTFFAPGQNPLGGGGTPAGTYKFTGTRVTVP